MQIPPSFQVQFHAPIAVSNTWVIPASAISLHVHVQFQIHEDGVGAVDEVLAAAGAVCVLGAGALLGGAGVVVAGEVVLGVAGGAGVG
jgi:hypothetical protein